MFDLASFASLKHLPVVDIKIKLESNTWQYIEGKIICEELNYEGEKKCKKMLSYSEKIKIFDNGRTL